MSKIIVALDYAEETQAMDFIGRVDPSLCKLKIGKAMFTKFGPTFVKRIIDKGFQVFLDLKFHDIPQQVAGACAAAANLGVWMLNVHASGGLAMMRAAKAAVDQSPGTKLILIAVTVLTSLSEQDLQQIGFAETMGNQVLRLAKLTHQAELDGVVCSAQEAHCLKTELGKDFCLVTPGIRLSVDNQDDQKRIVTPQKAIHNGSHYLVIGRPITQSSQPNETLEGILKSIS